MTSQVSDLDQEVETKRTTEVEKGDEEFDLGILRAGSLWYIQRGMSFAKLEERSELSLNLGVITTWVTIQIMGVDMTS